MSESAISRSSDSASDSSVRQFNVLNPRDYYKIMQELSENTKLFDFMRKGFQLKYDMTRGLRFDELQELMESEHGPDAQIMLGEVQKLSDGQSTCLAAPSGNPKAQETLVVFGQMVKGKYDVLNIRVTQTKEIDQQKIIAAGLGAVFAGLLVSTVATPVVGAVATGAILASAGLKTIHDHQNTQPDLIYAYVFKELNDKHVIQIGNEYTHI